MIYFLLVDKKLNSPCDKIVYSMKSSRQFLWVMKGVLVFDEIKAVEVDLLVGEFAVLLLDL